MLKIAGIGLGILIVLILCTVLIGRMTFQQRVSREVAEMFEAYQNTRRTVVTEADLEGLPEPVQRWLRYANIIGKERVFSVRLEQEGMFRLAEDQAWMPFHAEEYYTTAKPAFIWHARFKMAPLLSIQGRDRYDHGQGHMWFKVLSAITVADATGTEVNQGALLRFLNEIMWFPDAALNDYIEWEPVDSVSARATMEYEGVKASAVFYFDDDGALTNMIAERYREINGQFELNTWSTPIHVYGEFNGLKIPTQGVGVWKLNTGDFPYINVKITEIEYNTPRMY